MVSRGPDLGAHLRQAERWKMREWKPAAYLLMAGRGRSPAQGQSYESYVPSAASCTSDGPLRRLGGAPGRSLSDSSRVPRYDSQERRNDICRPLRVLDSHVWCALCLGGGKPRCSMSRSLRRSAGWKPRSADKSSQRRPTSIHALALVDHAFCIIL